MKTRLHSIIAVALLFPAAIFGQVCSDPNGYVDHKNVGGTSSYQLHIGFEEYAGQTYNYSGPGKVTSIAVYGNYGGLAGVPLRVSLYNTDGTGRPTTEIQGVNHVWWTFDNAAGFISVNMPSGGVTVNNRFAVVVRVLSAFPYGSTFNLRYTGNGEGLQQDLASLAGTSTGNNWTSAKNNFNKDGDFYLVPTMSHENVPSFAMSSACTQTGSAINFSNTTQMTRDSMFNRIALSAYTGTNHLYSWNFGDGSSASYTTSPAHTYTAPGVYTVTLTSTIEGWGVTCTRTYTSMVSVGLNAGAPVTATTCFGSATGSVSSTASGGAPTYSYSLNNFNYQSANTFTGLAAGTYTFFVKDALGCVRSVGFNINSAPAINFGSSASSNATCGNANGNLVISASGGAGSIQLKLNTGSYQSSGTFTSLVSGAYTITAKDANGCTTATVVNVQDSGSPTITSVNTSQVACFGASSGTITVNANGGTGNLQYSINGGTFQSGNVFANQPAGVYAVAVKDGNGCLAVSAATITQPQAIIIAAVTSPALCYNAANGQINVQYSTGGTGSHIYSINGTNYQSSGHFTGLASGNHTLYAKDVANCVSSVQLYINQPSMLTASMTATNATCYGGTNGVITITTGGGTPGYVYSIDNGYSHQSSNSFPGLGAGTYSITVYDANNCATGSSITIGQGAVINTTVSTTNSTCGNTNGGVLVLAAGGAGGLQYSINGTTYQGSGSFTPLASGTYFVIVRDQLGCTKIASANVTDSNGPVITGYNSTNVSCNGGNNGSLNITGVNGGSGTLNYSINGSTWQTSPSFSNLGAGTYVVIVKDANGCTGTAVITITQPQAFLINTVVNNLPCNNIATGAVTITAGGGAGVLAFGLTTSPTVAPAYQASNIFSGLYAGTYSVFVKDAANCVGVQTLEITQPAPINLYTGVLNAQCAGSANGQINAYATGGVGIFMYALNSGGYSTNGNWNNLAGNSLYTVFAKDGNSCVVSKTLYLTEPAPLTVNPMQSNVSCAGGNNGAINLTVNGGTFPYTFAWSNGQNTQGIFNLTANVYSVTILDFNGCSSAMNFTITQPANPLIVNASVVHASSSSDADGSIDITVTGGMPPYTFSWSNGATTEDLQGVPAGAYLVTITDANGCITSATYFVGNILEVGEYRLDVSNVVVFPNPSSVLATVRANASISRIDVVNVLGQTVKSVNVDGRTAQISVSDLAAGSYFLKISGGGQTAIKRMIVSH